MDCPRLLLTSMDLSSATLPKEQRTPIPAGFFPDEVLPSSRTLSIHVYVCFTRSFNFCLLVSNSLRIPWVTAPLGKLCNYMRNNTVSAGGGSSTVSTLLTPLAHRG